MIHQFQLALFLLVFHVHFGISIRPRDSCPSRELTYSTERDRALENHVISTWEISDAIECGWKCLADSRCLSYNYKYAINESRVCELSDQSRSTKPMVFKPKSGFTYYEPRTDKKMVGRTCISSPCQNGATCVDSCDDYVCNCTAFFKGQNCEIPRAKSCQEIQMLGGTEDNVYTLSLVGSDTNLRVYCDQSTDGGGWTVIQRRISPFSVSFNRGWVEYQNGFGNVSGEFWLGNENIYRLTISSPMKLRIELKASGGQKGHAVYNVFSISGSQDKYRLEVQGYSGNMGNSLFGASNAYHDENKMQFSTPDRDNDNYAGGHCSPSSGWWKNWCGLADLNGKNGPHWSKWGHDTICSEMKIR